MNRAYLVKTACVSGNDDEREAPGRCRPREQAHVVISSAVQIRSKCKLSLIQNQFILRYHETYQLDSLTICIFLGIRINLQLTLSLAVDQLALGHALRQRLRHSLGHCLRHRGNHLALHLNLGSNEGLLSDLRHALGALQVATLAEATLADHGSTVATLDTTLDAALQDRSNALADTLADAAISTTETNTTDAAEAADATDGTTELRGSEANGGREGLDLVFLDDLGIDECGLLTDKGDRLIITCVCTMEGSSDNSDSSENVFTGMLIASDVKDACQ